MPPRTAGVEMFKKLLNEGQAGDNVGLLLRGIKRDDVERGQVGSSFICSLGSDGHRPCLAVGALAGVAKSMGWCAQQAP